VLPQVQPEILIESGAINEKKLCRYFSDVFKLWWWSH